MKFRAHETFFIRKGWLSKGMKNVHIAPDVFISHENNPMDVLGIGSKMVKSLRYWMVASGLTVEPIVGRREQTITPFGEIVLNNDRYFEELGTLFLVHYHLAKNYEEATSWYFFFNEFKLSKFSRDDFILHIEKFIREKGLSEQSERLLDDDFNCIINTYVSRAKTNPEKVKPESNIDCPLGELGLIDVMRTENNGNRLKIYHKGIPKNDMLHPLILLAVIIDQSQGEKEIRISSIQNDKCNAGKIFNLDIINLTTLLYKIELLGYIKVNRTAGLDVINIKTDWSFLDCVQEYYNVINN